MGQEWDSNLPDPEVWRLLLDYVHPGAVLAVFGGTRTYHKLASDIEDAGWEIFDSLACWIYASGFPKAHTPDKNNPGHKTALKPSFEPIVLARAPRGKYTYAQLAQQFGSGALNIDKSRIPTDDVGYMKTDHTFGGKQGEVYGYADYPDRFLRSGGNDQGRFPANTLFVCECEGDQHDPQCPISILNQQSGNRKAGSSKTGNEPSARTKNVYGKYQNESWEGYGDDGGAARFFYQAKASAWEREAGLDQLPVSDASIGDRRPSGSMSQRIHADTGRPDTVRHNTHIAVKPIQLCEYITRLLLPPELDVPRRILIPFSGSGSEMIGAHLAGWDEIVGIEMTDEYIPINEARRKWWSQFSTYAQAEKSRGTTRKEKEVEQKPIAETVEQTQFF